MLVDKAANALQRWNQAVRETAILIKEWGRPDVCDIRNVNVTI